MPSLTLKNIPEKLYEKLKRRASDNRRSMNSEILRCLERQLVGGRVDPDKFLAELDRLHGDLDLPVMTDEDLRKAKNEGRR